MRENGKRAVKTDTPHEVVEAPLAPELRRAAWYVLLLFTAGALICSHYPSGDPAFDKDTRMFLGIFQGAAVILVFFAMWWRVRVDAVGVHVRLLAWQFWPWTLFEEGHAHKAHSLSFEFRKEPWYRRTVRFGVARGPANEEAYEICLKHWKMPAADVLPEQVKITTLLLERLILDNEGIERRWLGMWRQPWAAVEKVVFYRHGHELDKFRSLLIFVGKRRISLNYDERNGSPFWGERPERIAAFIERHVSSERIIVRTDGEPLSVKEVDERLLRLRKERREWSIVSFITIPAMIWLFVHIVGETRLSSIASDPFRLIAFLMLVMLYGVAPSAALFLMFRRFRREEQELLTHRETLDKQENLVGEH